VQCDVRDLWLVSRWYDIDNDSCGEMQLYLQGLVASIPASEKRAGVTQSALLSVQCLGMQGTQQLLNQFLSASFNS
jgi:hypothetical protein